MGSSLSGLAEVDRAFTGKRVLDIVVALIALVVAAPLFVLIAVLIKVTSPGPVIFRQERVGKGGRRFVCYKFRTMYDGASSEVHREYLMQFITNGVAHGSKRNGRPIYKIDDDNRVTRIGRFLRRLSLDELPQLLNVLRGEMSLVGPRPAIDYEVGHYKPHHFRRLSVLPGITGLWQVSGRNLLTFEEMIRLDLEYIDNWSLWLDLAIMLRTIPAILAAQTA